jgi:hypothetical protein
LKSNIQWNWHNFYFCFRVGISQTLSTCISNFTTMKKWSTNTTRNIMRNYKLNDRFLSVANFSNLIKHAQQTEGIRVHFGWAAICAFGLGPTSKHRSQWIMTLLHLYYYVVICELYICLVHHMMCSIFDCAQCIVYITYINYIFYQS